MNRASKVAGRERTTLSGLVLSSSVFRDVEGSISRESSTLPLLIVPPSTPWTSASPPPVTASPTATPPAPAPSILVRSSLAHHPLEALAPPIPTPYESPSFVQDRARESCLPPKGASWPRIPREVSAFLITPVLACPRSRGGPVLAESNAALPARIREVPRKMW